MKHFGSGTLYGIPATGDRTPRKFGILQEVNVEISTSSKEMKGQNLFAVDVARTGGKITFKAKAGEIDPAFYNAIFFGGDLSTGYETMVRGEAAAVPDDPGPFTVQAANVASWLADRGVIDAVTGRALTLTSNANPGDGEYKVAAGVYTFNAVQKKLGVKLDYTRQVLNAGHTLSFSNPLQGDAPEFILDLHGSYKGKNTTLRLFRCISNKLAMPFKNEDHTWPDFEGQAFANDAGDVFKWFFSE